MKNRFIKSNNEIKRPQNLRKIREKILIICEGERTEPNYFRGFVETFREVAEIKIEGLGRDPKKLVYEALNEKYVRMIIRWMRKIYFEKNIKDFDGKSMYLNISGEILLNE